MKLKLIVVFLILASACKDKREKIKPKFASITESVYASGIIKSKDQYELFSTVNGIIDSIYVSEGDTVQKGDIILVLSNEVQRINKENAQLSADYSDLKENQGKLAEALSQIELARTKMRNDSALFIRQANLWKKEIGSKVDYENVEMNFQNSKTAYQSAIQRHTDLKRQLSYNSSQTKKNLQISNQLENDFIIRSKIDGLVYSLNKKKGELVNIQTLIGVIGDSKMFILEMQVDEYDILQIRKGQNVMVSLDSYKGQVFEARVSKINPIMNEQSKSFLVEAEFVQQPTLLYPNVTLEANILLQTKKKALLIPRKYALRDSLVILSSGDTIPIKTGLKDYQKIEVIGGISEKDELINPGK
jgi:HlyD family secretion protein